MNWLKKLDKWTEDYTREAVALIGLLIGTGIVLVLRFQEVLGTELTYFLLGFSAANLLFAITGIIERVFHED